MENITPQILAMYIGQQVQTPSGIGELHEINNDGGCTVVFSRPGSGYDGHFFEDDVKPILRPLSDMTESEWAELEEITWRAPSHVILGEPRCVHAHTLARAIEMGFDVFNLIPAGLAIDKTKL